ncbi:MAG: Uma2 family endonuclease, partial [Fimbriiglobus sp.]
NLAVVFGAQLKGTPCRGRTKDTKVRSGKLGPWNPRATAGMYSYPDLVIVCGEPEFLDDFTDVLINPTVIVEVLSPSTESFDRGEKFSRYGDWNPTLTDYLLVSQDKPRVEHFTRQPAGKWLLERTDGLSATVSIPSIGVLLGLADVYERVTFPAPELDPVPEE